VTGTVKKFAWRNRGKSHETVRMVHESGTSRIQANIVTACVNLICVAVGWIASQLRIGNITGSNLGTVTGYPSLRFFLVFLSTSRKFAQ
jgi:hypothetical protein